MTLLEVHKLMYFMQEAGEPLRLRSKRGPYGPYAENLALRSQGDRYFVMMRRHEHDNETLRTTHRTMSTTLRHSQAAFSEPRLWRGDS